MRRLAGPVLAAAAAAVALACGSDAGWQRQSLVAGVAVDWGGRLRDLEVGGPCLHRCRALLGDRALRGARLWFLEEADLPGACEAPSSRVAACYLPGHDIVLLSAWSDACHELLHRRGWLQHADPDGLHQRDPELWARVDAEVCP